MKQLYRQKWITKTVYRNKDKCETIIDNSNVYSNIRYGEVPTESVNEIDEWDCLFNYFGYEKDFFGYKSRKGLWFNFNYSDKYEWQKSIKIHKYKFILLLEWNKVMIIKPSEIRMEQLIEELPVDQFIEYMVDNGLGMEGLV